MISWSNDYIKWKETTDVAIEEANAPNSHGAFYYNQLGALKFLVNSLLVAKKLTDDYFNTQYLTQVVANGEKVYCLFINVLENTLIKNLIFSHLSRLVVLIPLPSI